MTEILRLGPRIERKYTLDYVLRHNYCKKLYIVGCEDNQVMLYKCGRILLIVIDTGIFRRILVFKGKMLTSRFYHKDDPAKEEEALDFIDVVVEHNRGVEV